MNTFNKQLVRRRSMVFIATVMFVFSAFAVNLDWNFNFNSGDIQLKSAGSYTKVYLANGSNPHDAIGAPDIPVKYANILLPNGATDIEVSATGDLVLLASDVMPWPTQRIVPKSKRSPAFVEPDPVAYASSSAWPAAVATMKGVHQMQGSTFVSVRINPIVYVGSEKALYYRPIVTLTVTYKLPAATRGVSRRAGATEMVNALVVNPSEVSEASASRHKALGSSSNVDYLIITSDVLKTAFQTLADYRATEAGGSYSTQVVTTEYIADNYEGDDIQMKIRNCIKDYYTNHNLTYVVLGGDDSVVPDRDSFAGVLFSEEESTIERHMPTDLYYSDLTGTWKADGYIEYGLVEANVDMAPEVIVGRIPVRTAEQTEGYIAKVMEFETNLAFPRNSILLGGPAAWCRYYGNKRPTDDVATSDGHPGFRAPHREGYVSDSEMWLRRLYRDGIKPYWNNVEATHTVKIASDGLTSWDTSICGDTPLTGTNLEAWINSNYTHMMFSGHGYPQGWGLEEGYYIKDEQGHDIEDMWYDVGNAARQTGLAAFVYTDACQTAAFDEDGIGGNGTITIDVGTDDEWRYRSEPCLGEAFIRNPNGGALVYMGCSRYGWGSADYLEDDDKEKDADGYYIKCTASNYSDGGPSTVYAYKFYRRLYEGGAVASNRTIGLAFAMSKADMIAECGDYNTYRWIQFGLNYLGDPAIALYSRSSSAPAGGTLDLANNGDNDKVVDVANGGTYDVTLSDRTLYKDGSWNTLCLPFDVTDGDATSETLADGGSDGKTFTGTPLEGADIRTLEGASLTDGHLALNFTDPLTEVEAGVPYIVRWSKPDGYDENPSAYDITNPEFVGVTVKDEVYGIGFSGGMFVGTYSSLVFDYADPNILFIGAGNQLAHPKVGAKIGACRAYFDFYTYYYAKARSIELNYGTEGTTSIESGQLKVADEVGVWRTLDGREIGRKPAAKGVYLHGNRKVLINQ